MQVQHHAVRLVELALDRMVIEVFRRAAVTRGKHLGSDGVLDAHGIATNARMLVDAEGADLVVPVKGPAIRKPLLQSLVPSFDNFVS